MYFKKTLSMSVYCGLAILLFISLSCNKDKQKPTNKFVGKWDMVLVTGGIAGIHMTPAEWGHTASYAFYEDSTCVIKRDANQSTTTYATTVGTNPPATYLTFRNTGMRYEYSFAHDTLMLYETGLVDGFTEWYVRD